MLAPSARRLMATEERTHRPKARGRVSFSRFVPTTTFGGAQNRESFVTALPLKQPSWLRHRHCCLGRAASAPAEPCPPLASTPRSRALELVACRAPHQRRRGRSASPALCADIASGSIL